MAADQDLEFEDLDATDMAAEGDSSAGEDPNGSNSLPEVGDLPRGARDLEAVYDIPVQVSAVLGKSTMQVSQLLKLGRGAVVELDGIRIKPLLVQIQMRICIQLQVSHMHYGKVSRHRTHTGEHL